MDRYYLVCLYMVSNLSGIGGAPRKSTWTFFKTKTSISPWKPQKEVRVFKHSVFSRPCILRFAYLSSHSPKLLFCEKGHFILKVKCAKGSEKISAMGMRYKMNIIL